MRRGGVVVTTHARREIEERGVMAFRKWQEATPTARQMAPSDETETTKEREPEDVAVTRATTGL